MSEPLPVWLAPLLLPDELGASDRWAVDHGTPGFTLMQRAAAALARSALRTLPPGPIAVLCGPGNNGGDGLVAAQLLHEAGREVRVIVTRDPAELRGDAALARDACTLPLARWAPGSLAGVAGAIDALLGTGATGAPRGPEAEIVAALSEARLPVIACDLPTGIDAGTGVVAGAAVTATTTVTFHRPSPGHVVAPGKGHSGHVEVVDIGIPAAVPIAPQIGLLRDALLKELPARAAASHKFSAGAVVVVAGAPRYPGAAVLAARGAQRAGAGYVIGAVSEAAAAALHAVAPEVIAWPWPANPPAAGVGAWLSERLGERGDAIVAGPGLGDGEAAEQLIAAALGTALPVVLDADGLAPFAGEPERLQRSAPLVLTPHAGELGRLLGRSSAQIGESRLGSAREAAERSGAVVVLKGDDTIIADPGGHVAVNDLPAPALATAGTGDVLAGAMGALLAAGLPAFTAASAAVRLHARAGRTAALRCGSADGVVAWDVAESLPAAR